MTKKIAFFIRSMAGGGAQRAMVRLARGFAEAGHSVEALVLEEDGNFKEELSDKVKLTKLGPKRISGAILALARYLRRERPDAILVTEPACNVAVIAAKLLAGGSTRVLIREGLFPSVAATESPHRATRLAYRLAPFFYRYADVIVALASDLAKDLAKWAHLDLARITVIPINPVVTPELLAYAELTPKHPWFHDQLPVILGVGRLDRQKDFQTLIQAFERLRNQRPCRLMIIGEGPLRGELELLKAKSSFGRDIELPGFVSNPFCFMSKCSVFVLSSRYEGLPNALIEALASGASVVATNCPSGPSEIVDGDRYGRLVPVGDPDAMAQAIRDTLDRPVNSSQSKARGLEFTIARSSSLYLNALFPQRPVS